MDADSTRGTDAGGTRVADADGAPGGRLAELRSSARGWHGVQLAVLGFIGLCGVLQGDAGGDNPRWLQVLAGVLVLVALAVACVATALVASAAWPVYRGDPAAPAGDAAPAEVRRTARRLRAGIVLTFLAVVVLALAAASSWWPSRSAGATAVEVTTSNGVACGQLVPDRPGRLRLDVGERSVVVPLDEVVTLRLRDGCG